MRASIAAQSTDGAAGAVSSSSHLLHRFGTRPTLPPDRIKMRMRRFVIERINFQISEAFEIAESGAQNLVPLFVVHDEFTSSRR